MGKTHTRHNYQYEGWSTGRAHHPGEGFDALDGLVCSRFPGACHSSTLPCSCFLGLGTVPLGKGMCMSTRAAIADSESVPLRASTRHLPRPPSAPRPEAAAAAAWISAICWAALPTPRPRAADAEPRVPLFSPPVGLARPSLLALPLPSVPFRTNRANLTSFPLGNDTGSAAGSAPN